MSLINLKEVQELRLDKVNGQVRGMILKEDLKFVLEKKGTTGLKKIEEEMEKLGYSLKYNKINIFDWYPEKMNIVLFIIKKVFDFSDKEMREMGEWSVKESLLIKLAVKYFISLEKITKEIGNYWRRAHTQGNFDTEEFNKKERFIILNLKNFNTIHPAHCRYIEGYIKQVASYFLPKKKLKVEEVDCVFKNSHSHKFKISW